MHLGICDSRTMMVQHGVWVGPDVACSSGLRRATRHNMDQPKSELWARSFLRDVCVLTHMKQTYVESHSLCISAMITTLVCMSTATQVSRSLLGSHESSSLHTFRTQYSSKIGSKEFRISEDGFFMTFFKPLEFQVHLVPCLEVMPQKWAWTIKIPLDFFFKCCRDSFETDYWSRLEKKTKHH